MTENKQKIWPVALVSIFISVSVSAAMLIWYHENKATRVMYVDFTQQVTQFGEQYRNREITKDELEQRMTEYVAWIKDRKPNEIVLSSESVLTGAHKLVQGGQ